MILIKTLERDEGCVLTAYKDTVGVWTIGYGHTGREVVEGLVWSQDEADAQLSLDADKACEDLGRAYGWTFRLDPTRLRVCQNMCFNLGISRLLHFVKMMAAAQAYDYDEAANEMLNSTWATQVGHRAVRLADEMRTGLSQ